MGTMSSAPLGRHVVADVEDCDSPLLNDARALEQLLREAAVASGATVLSSTHHRFEPYGATALCVLAESHISIHTWPELGSASLDAYTCGETADPFVAVDHVLRALAPGHAHVAEIGRGVHGFTAIEKPWGTHAAV